ERPEVLRALDLFLRQRLVADLQPRRRARAAVADLLDREVARAAVLQPEGVVELLAAERLAEAVHVVVDLDLPGRAAGEDRRRRRAALLLGFGVGVRGAARL